jgi:hypothetical protein
MRVAAERRSDGVFVAAGVELVEPEFRSNVGVRSAKIAKLGDSLGWETTKRLRAAVPDESGYRPRVYMSLMLKACHCGAAFVGVSRAQHCPSCQREATLNAAREAVRRIRVSRRAPLAGTCRQCGAPMTAKRSTKAFCSGKCRMAANRARKGSESGGP